MAIYFLIGMIYFMINIMIRKDMNEDENPLLGLAWILIWPIFFIPLVIVFFNKKKDDK